jgi:hypothetical protein
VLQAQLELLVQPVPLALVQAEQLALVQAEQPVPLALLEQLAAQGEPPEQLGQAVL